MVYDIFNAKLPSVEYFCYSQFIHYFTEEMMDILNEIDVKLLNYDKKPYDIKN